MGKVFEGIDADLTAWIGRQQVFFVATAPLAREGFVNCSPKGMQSFQILDPQTVAYLDLTGSGAETAAHLRENGRIVIMFCALAGPPRVVRLHGQGELLLPGSAAFEELQPLFPDYPGARAAVRVACRRISDSCGYGVPLYEYRGQRDTLRRWAEHKGIDGLKRYREENNARSLDGLPALSG